MISRRIFTSRWGFLVIAVGMATLIVDRHVEMRTEETRITRAISYVTNAKGRHYEWSLVQTEMGISLQIQRPVASFKIGRPISIQRTGMLGELNAYRSHNENWQTLEEGKENYRPLPYVILICSLLMLLKEWPDQTSYMIIGIMFIIAVTWALMLIAMNAMRVLVFF